MCAKFQLYIYQSTPQIFTWTSRYKSPPRTVPALRTLIPKVSAQSERSEDWKKILFKVAYVHISPSLLLPRTRLRGTYECDPPNRSSRPAVFQIFSNYWPSTYSTNDIFWKQFSNMPEHSQTPMKLTKYTSSELSLLDAILTSIRPPHIEKSKIFYFFKNSTWSVRTTLRTILKLGGRVFRLKIAPAATFLIISSCFSMHGDTGRISAWFPCFDTNARQQTNQKQRTLFSFFRSYTPRLVPEP